MLKQQQETVWRLQTTVEKKQWQKLVNVKIFVNREEQKSYILANYSNATKIRYQWNSLSM